MIQQLTSAAKKNTYAGKKLRHVEYTFEQKKNMRVYILTQRNSLLLGIHA